MNSLRKHSRLWRILMQHPRYGVAAVVFAVATGVLGNFLYDRINLPQSSINANEQIPLQEEAIKRLRYQIDEALHNDKIEAALQAVSRIPKGRAKEEECGRIHGYAVKAGDMVSANKVSQLCWPNKQEAPE